MRYDGEPPRCENGGNCRCLDHEIFNPMERLDFVMTHVFVDNYTKKAYAVTLVGPFLRTSSEARKMVAEREDVPELRLQSCCSIEPGTIVCVHLEPNPQRPHRLPVGVLADGKSTKETP